MPPARGRAVVVLALAVLVAAVPNSAYAKKTVGLSSGSFLFTVDPGFSGSGEVIVSCDGDEPIKVMVYVADVKFDSKGDQTFVTPQREGASLLSTPASWFRMYMPEDSKSVGNTPYVEMDPGEQIPIRFEFSPPVGTAPGDHNTIILFEMFEFSNSQGSSAQVSGRLGARVALRVTGQTVDKMSIRPFEVPSFRIGGEIPFRFVVNNDGNMNQRAWISAVVLDRDEAVVASSDVATDTALYAQSSKEFRGTVFAPGTSIGPRDVEVRVEYVPEGQQLPVSVTEHRQVWMIPLWVVVLIGFVVGYSLLFLVYRALKKRRERKRAAAARRKSHKARDAEAEERRRRREERAAAVDAGKGQPPE